MTSDQDSHQALHNFVDGCQSLYPDIPWMTAHEFMDMRGERHWVIVDVRTDAERQVSIIPGAMFLADYQQHAAQHKGQPVLVYCTVGCRSASHTDNLRAQGIEAYNLWGGVLDWAAAGGAFTTLTGQPTHAVHTHGRRWDLLPPAYTAVW